MVLVAIIAIFSIGVVVCGLICGRVGFNNGFAAGRKYQANISAAEITITG